MGLLSWTTMSNVTPEGEAAVGMKPLLKGLSKGWQGLSKLDCTTEWFLGLKLNSTTVLGSSSGMLAGEKVRAPLSPTSMCSLRRPPTGRRSGGEVLGVGAFLASSLKASNVFPLDGLEHSGQIG